ncbi:hypothetical protein TNCV_3331861 [Trichonephila clavipes]|nr:hypothetical protein TNCV_3331861 [Trichonephila clavipes]
MFNFILVFIKSCLGKFRYMDWLLAWKIPYPVGYKVCCIGWIWLVKTSLYFSPMILPFRVMISPAENHDTDDHIMIGPLRCLTVGSRQSRSYAL